LKANLVMTKELVVCHPDQTVLEVLKVLRERSFHVLPVVDENNKLLGAVNMLSMLSKLVPEYILNGYLKSIPYAPDMGVLRKHYKEIIDHKVVDIMEKNPTVVGENESLLSVTAALISFDRFEYAFVVDKDHALIGIVAASDIVRALSQLDPEVLFDA